MISRVGMNALVHPFASIPLLPLCMPPDFFVPGGFAIDVPVSQGES